MRLPLIEGEIERRLLVNYRVDPEAMARQLPAPFRPQLVGGGGRLYPGMHHPASFQVLETRDQVRVAFRARDGSAEVEVEIRIVEELGGSAIFRDADEASAFFEKGAAGFSATRDSARFDGLELRTYAPGSGDRGAAA